MELLSAGALSFMLAVPFDTQRVLNRGLSSLNVSDDRIGSVVVRADTNGSSSGSYELKVFADAEETRLLVKLKRPRSGKIVDVDLGDIDHDGQSELVVIMVDSSAGFDDVSVDAFDLNEDRVNYIDSVLPVEDVMDWIRSRH